MQKILVPTDFSGLSENALKLAVSIGGGSESEIYLVHFMDHPFGRTFNTTGEINTGDSETELFTLQLARKNQQRLAAAAQKYGDNIKINYQLYDDEFDDGFKDYIEEQSIDLAVIGTSGEESAEEFFTGNHTRKLIESATCPIISIKGDYKEVDFKHIIVGIDHKQDDDENMTLAAKYINAFASQVNAKLHLLHVADLDANRDEMKAEIEAYVSKFDFSNYDVHITQSDDKEQGILSYAFATGASMLTILTHAEKSFFRIFTDSTAEEISQKASVPVMVINLHHIT